MTNHALKQGEELLCDYLQYIGSASAQDWEEDIASLRGSVVEVRLDITCYESRQARRKVKMLLLSQSQSAQSNAE